jgi:DNA-binding response OmpR family regulator
MRVLVAEDDPVSRRLLAVSLRRWGYEVVEAVDGEQAWDLLQQPDAPNLVILDWMMPGVGGIEICRRVRQAEHPAPAYMILLTARTSRVDIVEGLGAGANDYITKPFDREELRARIQCGVRTVHLEISLAQRVCELEEALSRVRVLQGLLPICSYCKKIRDDRNYWQRVEEYITAHTDAVFSHGICPECFERVVRPQLEQPNPIQEKP